MRFAHLAPLAFALALALATVGWAQDVGCRFATDCATKACSKTLLQTTKEPIEKYYYGVCTTIEKCKEYAANPVFIGGQATNVCDL